MMGTQHAWIWATLQEMAALAAEQEAAEKEVARLTEAYRVARERVVEAVPDLSIEATVGTLRLIGAPPDASPAAAPAAPAAESTSPAADPLAIPTYLRRGDGVILEGDAKAAGTVAETETT